MNEEHAEINRRNFLKSVGAAGLGSVLAGCKSKKAADPNAVDANDPAKPQPAEYPQVPKRTLGKTGVKVPCLILGGNQDLIENQIVLIKAPQWGLTYWDTANNYTGGNSELGIGKYLSKNPDMREKLFICSKASRANTIEEVQQRFQTSLERMKTDYIDLYFGVHQCPNPARLNDELKQWAEDEKKRKRIRFFGISTHQNMPEVLTAASKLGWIEVAMTIYNFRLAQDEKLQAAIDACHKANIGLIAIKTQGMGQRIKTDEDKKLVDHFLQRGFTEGQAKIKLVLEDERFTAACVGMQNINLLTTNVAVALDKTKLTQQDKELFKQYAQATCDSYCAGCACICNSALPDAPYVSDIMRYLMYYNSYDEKDRARQLFAEIPKNVRSKLLSLDYRLAEARCPQHLPIRQYVTEAVSKLA